MVTNNFPFASGSHTFQHGTGEILAMLKIFLYLLWIFGINLEF